MSAEPCFLSAFHTARAAEWRPGLAGLAGEGALHSEIFASSREGTGAALALALAMDRLRVSGSTAEDAADQRPWLWVQDAQALRRSGRPYRPGLPGLLRHRLVHVAAKSPEDALFAIEEGLRCRELAFVIAEIAGNPRALDFTASRRFSLAVEKHGVPLWLVRLDAKRDLGSAKLRWEARTAVSPGPRWNPQAPGAPSWQAELFRARSHPPGAWVLREYDGLVAERVGEGITPLAFRGGAGGVGSPDQAMVMGIVPTPTLSLKGRGLRARGEDGARASASSDRADFVPLNNLRSA